MIFLDVGALCSETGRGAAARFDVANSDTPGKLATHSHTGVKRRESTFTPL